eukprot:CAMPEP_0198306168 /NCGR_PEP_ID=MMETSP1449-20131203/58281_1 /TAXON_ID=420275 /ORGANISM="Attheya septentrionalis, Strain CCMP2084" /LENGTH=351 /DNA_ID=CAMNT_0044008717 /DNA_START=36 /DNA_END=1091 /DNA_ORIENTATION=+
MKWHVTLVMIGIASMLQIQGSDAFVVSPIVQRKTSLTKNLKTRSPATLDFPLLDHHVPSPHQNNMVHTQIGRGSNFLKMSSDSDDDGPGIGTIVTIVFFLVVFVGTSLAPMLDAARNSPTGDLNLGDSVVTRQDPPGKLKNYENSSDKLSRTKIQEKLNRVPVFYLVSGPNREMQEKIYLSFEDATSAAGSGATVKCTTLDQVMYPLVLKRGRMRMAPPPLEVQQAEETLQAQGLSTKNFKLIPSKAAIKDAAETKTDLADGDIPLFVADRLAFAGDAGPQVPLFFEKADCITSYDRLRESRGDRIPAQPNIRSTTLMDELYSMEKGTRPAVSQLQFYSTADDLMRASEML